MEDKKAKEDQISRHMLQHYSSLFKQKPKKNKISEKNYIAKEHHTYMKKLKERVWEIGSISTKNKVVTDPLIHPVYTKRNTTGKFTHSQFFTNLSLKHPKYLDIYENLTNN
ncbi:hypothetical protein SteCoe_22447 [Stentor coeruleus]|uniref:Uncharacterized protein n=1 Tax=Stentor coeruleus TaxID=5963 RepID=A0A1R2BMC9_9CILI|nr:hypothetical protein SteCoe_22447 [Stentor coeruleus]